MRNVVLLAHASGDDARDALVRALARFPAAVVAVAVADRPARLRAAASDPEVEWIALIDADVVPAADAFGGLRRILDARPAIVGGRAIVGSSQRLGAMFGPARSGPDPFVLVPLAGLQSDRAFTDLVRGPVDVPQRGVTIVSAAFVRSLGDIELDPQLLYLDLAVRAHIAGLAVMCEPSLTYSAGEDSLELRDALGDLRRYAALAAWKPETLHRDPSRVRSAFVTREVRVMGAIRGYARRPYPPLEAFIVAADELGRARAQRASSPLGAAQVTVIGPADGETLRRALARTSDRYILVTDAAQLPDRAAVEQLIERAERSGRIAVALERAAPPHGAVLFHCSRIVNAGALAGATVADVVDAAIAALPRRRFFASTPAGDIVPEELPELPVIGSLDVVFVAASKPAVTQQTVQAVMGEPLDGDTFVVYPAGSATTEKLFAVHAGLRLMPDDSDVQLAVGLNRALGACTAAAVVILRDDAQIPHGTFGRLRDAFRRIPRLGIAVPRIGGTGRPESLPDLGYRNIAEMQQLYDRRAEAFAREVSLLDIATAPVMVVSREALDVVGGFDELFGFSRLGVEDFVRRVRSANFLVACCEDAYAHVFAPLEAASFVGNLDDSAFLRAAYEKRWLQPRPFDAETDRVPFRTDAGPAIAPQRARTVRILLPLRDDLEWERSKPLLADLAAEFRVGDPVEVAVGLDGTFGLQTALAELRELLIASGVPMEETLNVNIDFVPDVAEWRDAGENNARLAAVERDPLAQLPAIDGPAAVRALLAEPTA